MYLRDGLACRHCRRAVSVQAGALRGGEIKLCDDAATLDHVDPEGGHGPDNLVTCCAACNRAKGATTWGVGPHPPAPDALDVLIFRARHWPGQY